MPNKNYVSLNDALADYYEARQPRYAVSTWQGHETQLELFRAWVSKPAECGPNCALRDVDERAMLRYFNRLRPPVLEGASFNNYRQYLNQFWKWCLAEGWIERNPMRHVDPASVPRKRRLQLSAQELLSMLDGASPRDRIGLALGMNTALRAGDLMTLKIGDVNLSNNTLHAFISKTRTYDDIPITSELRDELLRWLPAYAEAVGLDDWMQLENDWTLCPPANSQALNVWAPTGERRLVYKTKAVYRHPEEIVHRALERLKYPTYQEGFHTLRRSTARRVYELAMEEEVQDPIRIAQALLGHKHRQTTEIYLGITVDKEIRDGLMRGQSFLRRMADTEIRTRDSAADGRTRVVDVSRRRA